MPSMQFIDFEYGCHSYRGYDWGNHFCEYAGFECAYSRYPNKEHVALFIRAYLSEGATSPPVSLLFSHLLKMYDCSIEASIFILLHSPTHQLLAKRATTHAMSLLMSNGNDLVTGPLHDFLFLSHWAQPRCIHTLVL